MTAYQPAVGQIPRRPHHPSVPALPRWPEGFLILQGRIARLSPGWRSKPPLFACFMAYVVEK
ncbi:MAG: hypothetical protein ACI4MK_09615 [Aristaeellaceae bacterium]